MLTQLTKISMDIITTYKSNILTTFTTTVKVEINATGCVN